MEVNKSNSIDFVNNIHTDMKNNKLILVFEGEFSQEVTKTVLTMAEKNMDNQGADSSLKKKVFNVMMESLQNICKHQSVELDEKGEVSAIFMIGKNSDGEYFIISGNMINDDHISEVVERIDLVNSKDALELKKMYKDRMRSGSISDVGGAGLGFIDMARKSGNKLIYEFRPVRESCSFYTLFVKISPKKRG